MRSYSGADADRTRCCGSTVGLRVGFGDGPLVVSQKTASADAVSSSERTSRSEFCRFFCFVPLRRPPATRTAEQCYRRSVPAMLSQYHSLHSLLLCDAH